MPANIRRQGLSHMMIYIIRSAASAASAHFSLAFAQIDYEKHARLRQKGRGAMQAFLLNFPAYFANARILHYGDAISRRHSFSGSFIEAFTRP